MSRTPTSSERPEAAWPLAERPGFLARRLHQIHGGLFAEFCGAFRITPLQYSLLTALSDCGVADQTSLARIVTLDRTTTTGALKRLEARGLVRRVASDTDRRSLPRRLTAEGEALLLAIEGSARRAHEVTLDPLDAAERAQFLGLLMRVVSAHDGDRPPSEVPEV